MSLSKIQRVALMHPDIPRITSPTPPITKTVPPLKPAEKNEPKKPKRKYTKKNAQATSKIFYK